MCCPHYPPPTPHSLPSPLVIERPPGGTTVTSGRRSLVLLMRCGSEPEPRWVLSNGRTAARRPFMGVGGGAGLTNVTFKQQSVECLRTMFGLIRH